MVVKIDVDSMLYESVFFASTSIGVFTLDKGT